MGSHLNEAEDSEPLMSFYGVWLRRYLACRGELPRPDRDAARTMAEQALARHLESRPDTAALWGAKVPRTILMLPFWHELLPELSFVHVVRNGLDMAYSTDRNQLRMAGDLVLPFEERRHPDAPRAIAYWQRVNLMAADFGETVLGPRYLRLRFEDVCARPGWAFERLRGLLGRRSDSTPPDVIEKEVQRPPSIGRWRTHPAPEIERLRELGVVALRRFGYGADT
jgi:hypothetical protein